MISISSFSFRINFEGFTYGFRIFSDIDDITFEGPNLLSAQQSPHIVETKLFKEMEAHRLAGPFPSHPLPHFRVSPLGVVPQKTPGEYCMIHHLSYPKGMSVNDGISSAFTRVTYATIDDAVRGIKRAGVGSYLAKTDVKHAFRIIPINPLDYHLLGMQWKGKYYFDKLCL